MKKYFALFLSIIMVFVALSACTPAENTDDTTTTQNYFTTTAPTTVSTTDGSFEYYRVGLPGLGYDGPLEYTGEAIERECVISLPSDQKASMVLFTDGYLQPYSVDDGEYGYIHVLPSGTYTLRFHPVSGKAGETVQFVSCSLIQPKFEKIDDTYFEFQDYHSLGTTGEVNLIMKADAPDVAPDIADGFTYTKELETIFRKMSMLGDKPVSQMGRNSFRVYDKVVDLDKWGSLEDAVAFQNDITAQRGTEHEVFICGYGKAGTYRVSLFINNELQYAFDGKAYVDMEISGDMQTTCSVKIDTEKLNKENYIYLVYYPLGLEIDELPNQVKKTHSYIFYVN